MKIAILIVVTLIAGALIQHFRYMSELNDMSATAKYHSQQAEKYYVLFLGDSVRLADSLN